MSGDPDRLEIDHLSAGRAAIATGAWEEARAAFEAALRLEETAEALDGLGWAAWWLNDVVTMYDARERAYRRYQERADHRGAAGVAIALAVEHFYRRGERAVANGWLRRAHRLLEGLAPGLEQAALAIWEGQMAIELDHDTAAACRLGAEAEELAHSLGSQDLEVLARALRGRALVREGQVDAGMRLLDEATATAVAGDMTDLDAVATACCNLIDACECVRDYERAAQWCERVMQIAARWSYRFIFAHCRAHYAGVLIWRGDWAEAETELAAATEELAATFPAMAVEGIVRLVELRLRQGRHEETQALLDRLGTHPLHMLGSKPALLGRAALALDGGDSESAAELAERFLRSAADQDRMGRVAGLELLVRAQAARGDHAQAAATLQALEAIATAIATPPLRAASRFAAGVVAAAGGDHESARRLLEDAVDLYETSGAPHEVARARLALAGVLAGSGRTAAAEAEAQAALEALQRLGAARDAERAAALLRNLHEPPSASPEGPAAAPRLTGRELDVLRLVARGLGDKEIAAALGLSEHTVHRHVANVLVKLALPSRAAAVAHAAHHHLL